MDPVCFHLFNRPIYWYGVLVAAGFLAAVANWNILGKKTGRPAGFGSELGFWIMLSGILGARVAYIIANLSIYLANPFEIIRLDKGGLIFYGGFIGAAICIVFSGPRAQRTGLEARGLYGHRTAARPCDRPHRLFSERMLLRGGDHRPLGRRTQDAVRHPTQLYESAFNLLVYGLLLWFYPRRKQDGQVLALYLLTYPVGRFLLEFFRGDERLRWLGFHVAQEISLSLFAIGVILWLVLRSRKTARE